MPTYCYAVTIDGEEQPVRSRLSNSRDDAINFGQDILNGAVKATAPAAAYCVVYEDAGTDDEPLGAWEYDAANQTVVWTAEE